MRKPLHLDPALWFFGVVMLACLSVSLPATLIAMELFHGATWGKPAVVVFEIGAVGSELASIAIPQWRKRLMALTVVLLLATTGTNYAHGADLFVAAALPRSYATVRDAGWGWAMAVVAAGLFPALLFVFLTAFTARWRMLRGGYETPLKVFAFWTSAFWLTLNTRLSETEQRAALAEQRATDYEQQMTEARALAERQAQDYERRALDMQRCLEVVERRALEREQQIEQLRCDLNTRTEIEVVYVARAKLTLEQAAALFGCSVSTVRRRLPALTDQHPTAERRG